MSDYLQDVEGKKFTDLVNDENFQRDLVRFFSGDRYGYSLEEIQELGPQGLAEEFVQHMRWQSTNEMTALNDFRYVNDEEAVTDEERRSFGNLMTAFDRSEGGGDGFFAGAGDYISAFATSPSTIATVATAGWGIGSKLSARAAGVATQAAIRNRVAALVAEGASVNQIRNEIAGTVAGGAVRGGVTSAAVEGGIGAGQGYLTGETREVATEGETEYSTTDLLRDGAISALTGGIVGSAARGLDVRTQRNVIENYASRESAGAARREAAREAATDTITKASDERVNDATGRATDVANTLVARYNQQTLNPLDPELVARGDMLREEILGATSGDRNLTPGLSIDTLRGVTAATIELSTDLGLEPGERISSAVARALRPASDGAEPRLTVDRLEEIRDKYNLSREEMSYIYLSDLSRAGRVLAEASQISRAVRRGATPSAQALDVTGAEREVQEIASDIGRLSETRVSTISETDANNIVRKSYEIGGDFVTRALQGAREVDSLRIAFMTSQVGTTLANTATSSFNLALDISNEFFKSISRTVRTGDIGELNPRRMFDNMFSTMRGMTMDRDDALLVRGILEKEYEQQYRNLFFETTRAETTVGGSSRFARVGRFVNTLNTATDSVFKQAALFSGLDRRIRQDANLPFNSLGEFLRSNRSMTDLPQEILDGAFDDARRFTFQRTYYGDQSAFGRTAQFVERTHQRLPFVISAVAGVPFPRYMANHLEHISDYTPIGLVTGGLDALDARLYGDITLAGDQFKSIDDRFARQMTGVSMILGGVYLAAQGEGEIDYDKILTDTQELDLSRTAGPYLLNLYIGDAIYRMYNGLPVKDVAADFFDIAVGMTDLAPQTGLIDALRDSVTEGEFTDDTRQRLGDIAATFTYPLTIFRDIQAQINPEAVASPYTRPVFAGDPDNPSTYGEGNYLEDLMMRSSRMLPDYDFFQLTQSYNGRNDIPYWDPIAGRIIGSFNPVTTQFGFRAAGRPNELQRELNLMDFEEYEFYGSRTEPNAAVDVVVRERLAKSLPQMFTAWRSQVQQQGIYAGQTYDEIEDVEAKRNLLDRWLKSTILSARQQTTDDWEQFRRDRPRAAAGYIRNLYVIREAELQEAEGAPEGIYDAAVSQFVDGFSTAQEYLEDAETIEQELSRREYIMAQAAILSGEFVGSPQERTRGSTRRIGN